MTARTYALLATLVALCFGGVLVLPPAAASWSLIVGLALVAGGLVALASRGFM